MVNELLEAHGEASHVLVPMQVQASDLGAFMRSLRHLTNFDGAVVTMPHKTAMYRLVDMRTAAAEIAGAVNVIRRRPDGRFEGALFDGEGFVAGLRTAGHEVAGKDCLVMGAGGAASAVAAALLAQGCGRLHLANRTLSSRVALAERLRRAFPASWIVEGEPTGDFDIAVNATSLGMKESDPLPCSVETIDRATLVAECVLAPERTRLLEVAEARGKRVHGGVAMLRAQMGLMLSYMTAR